MYNNLLGRRKFHCQRNCYVCGNYAWHNCIFSWRAFSL